MTSPLSTRIDALRSALTRLEWERDKAEASVEDLDARTVDVAAQLDTEERVVKLLMAIADSRNLVAQQRIESVVTVGLQQIFDEGLSFHLAQSERGNSITVDMIVRTTFEDGSTLDTPVAEARGGGLASVVGFLLRVTLIMLTPGARRLLILDESFAALSVDYEPRVAEFIRELCDKAGFQVVLVTHSDAYNDSADVVYRFALDKQGHTKVKKSG